MEESNKDPIDRVRVCRPLSGYFDTVGFLL